MLKSRIKDKIQNFENSTVMNFKNKTLMIEITNHCNNKCIFCYNEKMKRKRKFIDENLCNKVLKEAHELGCREVGFYVTGEPLLNPKIYD